MLSRFLSGPKSTLKSWWEKINSFYILKSKEGFFLALGNLSRDLRRNIQSQIIWMYFNSTVHVFVLLVKPTPAPGKWQYDLTVGVYYNGLTYGST